MNDRRKLNIPPKKEPAVDADKVDALRDALRDAAKNAV